MVFEVAMVLLGVCVGAVAVLFAAPRGYLGHPRRRGSSAAVTKVEAAYAPTTEQVETPAEVAAVATEPVLPPAPAEATVTPTEPGPSPAPALYETVQPQVSPPPVTYASPSVAAFGASPLIRKPTRTYRRRAPPVRSTSASKAPRSTKTKKR